MADDPQNLQTPTRRATRSSSTPSKPSILIPKSSHLAAPTIGSDLIIGDESIGFDDLVAALPGRKAQILEILRLIGPLDCPMLPILLYGGASTGKTSAVLKIFRHLRRPVVYVSCRSCYSPRILFESVLNQLLLHRRDQGNGYSSAKKCERASDFVNLFREGLVQVINGIKDVKKKSCSKDWNGEMIYLIFDNVELIRSWDKSSIILSVLFRLFDSVRIPEVGFIYVSNASPDAYYSMTGSLDPIGVYFPDYTVSDLHDIFMRKQVNLKLYSAFLNVALKPFSRVTRRVDELAIALEPLFTKYCEPLTDLSLIPDERMKRKLFEHIQPYFTASLNETFKVLPWSSAKSDKEKTPIKASNARKLGDKVPNSLDFHLSVSAKYLLLSAFLASRNPATLDAALFDSTGGSNSHKRKRKSSQTAMDRKDEIAEEMITKGPGSFPLERLLAIFQCITSVAEWTSEVEQLDGGHVDESSNVQLMADVLLQLSTLSNANFIYKSSSCPLEGSARYRSMVDEDMALEVARSLNFPLSKYLYRR